MAEIETSLVTHMKTQSTITNSVGSRVYDFDEGDAAPRMPFIVVRPTTNVREAWTQTDYGGIARLSVYVYAETISKAREIGAAVMGVYKQYSGTLGNHVVQFVEVSNARALFGPNDDIRYLVDIIIHFTD